MRRVVGIGWRRQLARWVESLPAELGYIEITAEHFYDSGDRMLRWLSERFPVSVHGLGLSLGTPGPLDGEALKRFAAVAQTADAEYISEHIAFTRAAGVDLGHLNPISPTEDNLALLCEHALQLMEACERPLLLENITTRLRLEGEMSEPRFLNRLCEQSGAGILLDVTNLWINAQNHGFDPLDWLAELNTDNIRQVHIAGYSHGPDGYIDAHSARVQPELLELLTRVCAMSPVEAVILERDSNFPDDDTLSDEISDLEQACLAQN
jgi:uncharacterized protein (UPF0276 family)